MFPFKEQNDSYKKENHCSKTKSRQKNGAILLEQIKWNNIFKGVDKISVYFKRVNNWEKHEKQNPIPHLPKSWVG